MIILDYSAIAMAAFFARGSSAEEGMLRHFILNSIRMHNVKHREKYGKMVIACDSHSWRKEYYPQYKANRKKGRDTSDVDWNSVFDTFSKVKKELKENFPYYVLNIDNAEADDIIASVVFHVASEPKNYEKVLILSSDKDFIQLQKYNFVSQYSPMQKKFINGVDPTTYIKEHILKGDRGDGVPNFLSPDNTFVDELRQRPLSKRKLEAWIDLEPSDYCNEEMMRNYQRNRTLIDLSYIPDDIKEKCTETFLDAPEGNRKHLLNYFIKKKLKSLMENIGDF